MKYIFSFNYKGLCKFLSLITLSMTILSIISGCGMTKTSNTQMNRDVLDDSSVVTYQNEVDDENVLSEIKSAASEIQKSLDQLAHVRKSESESQEYDTYNNPKSHELNKNISFKWSGSLELATKILADEINYDFKVIGDKPLRPVTTSIDVVDTPIFRVLEQIGWQSEDKATLLVDERKDIVQLVYEGL